jgi:Glycosyl transferases group 1
LWFYLQGVQTLCVEASPDALHRTVLPASAIINHDFTRGPWWPRDTVDVAWCTAFVQQVSRAHMRNYLSALRGAAIVVVSIPGAASAGRGGGWHSVEVHSKEWWTVQFERHGFQLSHELTGQVREAARLDATSSANERGPDGQPYRTRDLAEDALVFLNPRVASLDRHDHLFPEIGCSNGGADINGTIVHRECGRGRGETTESALDIAYLPPPILTYKSEMWIDLVRRNIRGEHVVVPDDIAVLPPAAKSTHAPESGAVVAADLSQHAVRKVPEWVESGNWTTTPRSRIPVVIWPLWEYKDQPKVVTADAKHIEKDGVEESPFLELSDDVFNFHPDVVWVGNTGYGRGWNEWCHKFLEHIVGAQERRRQLNLATSWPIYIVDFTDYATRQRCRSIEQAVGPEFVTYAKRSMAKHRRWNPDKGWVDEGIRLPDETRGTGIVYRHAPLAVRTDTVLHLRQALGLRNLTLRDSIETLDRPIDAMHLWPLDANTSRKVGIVQSNLRSTVTRVVDELRSASSSSSSRLNVFVGLAGNTSVLGRKGVSSSYIEALLSAKILVVSQRDGWEDHYRLFEALVAGPLVLTDRMLGMPAGLVNGTSIVEYSSEDELRALIQYYAKNDAERIAIASEGRRVALSRHRSWHRMEEIIFGRPLTACDLASHPASGCPYFVHANESFARPGPVSSLLSS